MQVRKILFEPHGDDRGQLVAIEEYKDIPFDVKRVYYMYDTVSDAIRGKHAHKCLQQILICVNGNCKVLLDDGTDREIIILDKPNEGVCINNNVWREMFDFSEDAVLLVLASELYDESDYIRDYEQFLKYVNKRQFSE